MEEKALEENKLEQIDMKLNALFDEIIWLQSRLDDKRIDEKEEKLKREEEELRRRREDIMIEKTLSRNHYEEKYNNFKKGYYY